MYVDQRARERRAKSVVVSGLQPSDDVSDAVAFQRTCMLELGLESRSQCLVHVRSRDHNFQLPVCNNFSRKSFIILITVT